MASPLIVTLTQDNFESEISKAGMPVLVDFWAEWCGPCKQIAPALDELATEFEGKVKIGKVDVSEHQNLAAQFHVNGIPTFVVFKNGQVAGQQVGIAGGK